MNFSSDSAQVVLACICCSKPPKQKTKKQNKQTAIAGVNFTLPQLAQTFKCDSCQRDSLTFQILRQMRRLILLLCLAKHENNIILTYYDRLCLGSELPGHSAGYLDSKCLNRHKINNSSGISNINNTHNNAALKVAFLPFQYFYFKSFYSAVLLLLSKK